MQCLGRMRVYADNHEIQSQDWAQADHGRAGWQKVQSVFAYMIHSGQRGATRDAIGTAVWGGPFSANSLSRTFTTLRQTLMKACGPAFVEQALMITDDHCVLDPTYYHTDIQLFEHTFDAAVRMEQESSLELAVNCGRGRSPSSKPPVGMRDEFSIADPDLPPPRSAMSTEPCAVAIGCPPTSARRGVIHNTPPRSERASPTDETWTSKRPPGRR